MAWFSELFLPWLLDRCKDVADSERAKEGGNSAGVIMFLLILLFGALLGVTAMKLFEMQGDMVEARTRLESSREKIDELKKDNDDLSKENDRLNRDNLSLKEALTAPVLCPSGPTTRVYKKRP